MKSLPRGRHGLSREFVAQNQRERLLGSIAGCLDELGYEKTTVSAISRHARVSKSDFYRHFDSKDACFAAAYDDSVEQLRTEALAACAEGRDWADRVCLALAALLGYLAREPARANLLLVEGLRAGPDIYDRFQGAVQGFVPLLAEGAPAPASSGQAPEAIDEAVVGGVASLLGRRVLAGDAEGLERFFPDIAEFVLTPYVGTEEARRIVSSR
ncbi:MAG TPA: TetR/AcrR family transcriptional regulator [Solirubrobacterales bacterium]|nr:TetR/AcrR family transcriptional regulator [Solirubrobacterales bacterium]